jgi:hypothetical protein
MKWFKKKVNKPGVGWVASDNYLNNPIKKVFSKIVLFKNYLSNTSLKDYEVQKRNDNKTILTYYTENTLNTIVVYGFSGLMLTIMFTNLFNFTKLGFWTILGWSIFYWFLIRLLKLITKER